MKKNFFLFAIVYKQKPKLKIKSNKQIIKQIIKQIN